MNAISTGAPPTNGQALAYWQRLRFVVSSAKGAYVCTWWAVNVRRFGGLLVLTLIGHSPNQL
jgi:hypothetical protein